MPRRHDRGRMRPRSAEIKRNLLRQRFRSSLQAAAAMADHVPSRQPVSGLEVIGHEWAQGVDGLPVAGPICEVGAYPAEELQAQLSGAVEGKVEFLGEDAPGFSGAGLAPVQILVIGLDDLGVLDAFLGPEGGLEELQQVVGDANGDDPDGLGVLALAPGLALVEFLLLLVEGFPDAPAQAVGFAERCCLTSQRYFSMSGRNSARASL